MGDIKFDGILFGNGMTINLLSQLKPYFEKEKLYLLNIDEFLKRFISNNISPREEERIFKLFYNKKNAMNIKYFNKLKYELSRYCLNNGANIEKTLGRDMFGKSDYDIKIIKSIFPALYNIWFDILYDYIDYIGLEEYVGRFYESVKAILTNEKNIYTTNFDYSADKYLNSKHLHGKFIQGISKYQDIYLCKKNDKEFYFKCIWGWNGIGKLNHIKEISNLGNYKKEYFNFVFFHDENIKIENLLIYGLGFQKSGYMTDDFLESYPKYREDNLIGGIIDEHILFRIKGLQNLKQLENVTVSYYSESEKEHFKLLFGYYGISNVKFINYKELKI